MAMKPTSAASQPARPPGMIRTAAASGGECAPAGAVAVRAVARETGSTAPAVGSLLTQPMPGYHTCTHACASVPRMTRSPGALVRSPWLYPVTNRAGMPALRRITTAGGRELLAEATMGDEEEVVDGVLPARRHR